MLHEEGKDGNGISLARLSGGSSRWRQHVVLSLEERRRRGPMEPDAEELYVEGKGN